MNKKSGVRRKYCHLNLKIYKETFDNIALLQNNIITLTGLEMLKTDIIETIINMATTITPQKIIKEFRKFKKRVDTSTPLGYTNPET